MKSLLTLIFLVFPFIAKPLLGANFTPAMLDFTGDKIVTGTDYYILSTFEGPATSGGLSLLSGLNQTCPLNVIQEQLVFFRGLPLTFSNANDYRGSSVVYESTDLNIKFSATETVCNQSIVWKVGDYEKSTGQWFITGDGVEGNPGAQTLESWFKFEKASENAYKISHCPSVCHSCVTLCSDIGIYAGDGVRRLALSHTPILIVFVKGSNSTN